MRSCSRVCVSYSSNLIVVPRRNADIVDINNMIDMATTRTMALQIHSPRIIYLLLFGLGLLCSLLAGHRKAGGQYRSWLHIFGFAVITVIIVYVMLDVEYPRSGLLRLETADQLLVKAREGKREWEVKTRRGGSCCQSHS